MRSHEERVAETKRRIAKIEREKRLRRDRITMVSAAAACLVLLIGVSLAMPGIAASIQTGNYSGFETAAAQYDHHGFRCGGVPCAACRRVPRHARHCHADTDRRLFRL